MAGGNIIRIVGGKNTIETEEWIVYTDKFTAYANGGSHFTADCGTNFGNPKDTPPAGKYFVKGWWTDKNDKPIYKAYIGQMIRFHVQTQNIPDNQKVTFTVYDWDGMFDKDDKLTLTIGATTQEYNQVNIISNKGVIEWKTGRGSKSLIDEETDEIELYVECIYDDEKIELPEMESDYLKLYYTQFPLKMHQRSFAPWPRFGNFFFDSFKNSFHGDNRGFSLKNNYEEVSEDIDSPAIEKPSETKKRLEKREKRIQENGSVTSRLYQMIEFDYSQNGMKSSKAYCNMTQGFPMFVKSPIGELNAIQTPEHFEYYGEHSLISSDLEKGVINISIWGSDPLVKPAPDIRWKLIARLTLDEENNILKIKGNVIGKGFPAYEAYIEDSKGKRLFLHAFMPKTELLVTSELDFLDIPDYFKEIEMEIEVVLEEKGYSFGNSIKNAILNSRGLEEKISEISINEWNNLHLSIPISKDIN